MTNGKSAIPWISTGLILVIAVVGWVLWSQSAAKDAGHETILFRMKTVETTDVKQNEVLDAIVRAQERILASQENFKVQLDRIERKISP